MRKKSVYLWIVLLALILFSTLYLFLFYFPDQTRARFGEADANLNFFQSRRLAVWLYLHGEDLNKAMEADSGEKQEFSILTGETASQVSTNLAQAGFIADESSFLRYLVYKGYDRILQSGTYYFSRTQAPTELALAMIDPTPEDVNFVILPGMRLEEIVQLIPTSGLNFTSEELLSLIETRSGIDIPEIFAGASNLEGLILAGDYTILRETSAAEFLQYLIEQSAAQFTPEVVNAFIRQGLSPYQAMTLASVVEREAVKDEEKPSIASVFLNRLQVNMLLQSDPTVQYALGWDEQTGSWWKTPLTSADLAVFSPYNTYRVNGLPPTPICAVSVDSLIAVAFPADTEYFYFRSACDGSGAHVFAESYEDHQSNACQ